MVESRRSTEWLRGARFRGIDGRPLALVRDLSSREAVPLAADGVYVLRLLGIALELLA